MLVWLGYLAQRRGTRELAVLGGAVDCGWEEILKRGKVCYK